MPLREGINYSLMETETEESQSDTRASGSSGRLPETRQCWQATAQIHCSTGEQRKESRGGSVWEKRDSRRNQGEKLDVAVVIQACLHVAVVIHTRLLFPPAMTLRYRRVRVSETAMKSSVGGRVITGDCCHCAAGQRSPHRSPRSPRADLRIKKETCPACSLYRVRAAQNN